MSAHIAHDQRMQQKFGRVAMALVALATTALLAGCGGKEEETAQAPAPRESVPAERPAEPVAAPTLTFEPTAPAEPLDLPPGVEFPEERQPGDRALGEAIASAAGALRSGELEALAPMLAPGARASLDLLADRGFQAVALRDIERVRVCSVEYRGDEASVGLGVQRSNGAVLLSLRAARSEAGDWVMQGLTPALNPFAPRVEAFDDVRLAEAPIPDPLPEQTLPEDAVETQTTPTRRRSSPGGIR